MKAPRQAAPTAATTSPSAALRARELDGAGPVDPVPDAEASAAVPAVASVASSEPVGPSDPVGPAGQISPVGPVGRVGPVGPIDPIGELARRLQAGELAPAEAVELVVDEVVSWHGQGALGDQLKQLLRQQLASDPHLGARARRLGSPR